MVRFNAAYLLNAIALCLLTCKVTVRGLAVLKAERELEKLISFLDQMQGALPETVLV